MVMRAFSGRFAQLFERDAALSRGDNPPDIPTLQPPRAAIYPPFTELDWRHAQLAREAADAIALCRHWHVSVRPVGEHSIHHFYLRGSHAQVSALVERKFPSSAITIEPSNAGALSRPKAQLPVITGSNTHVF